MAKDIDALATLTLLHKNKVQKQVQLQQQWQVLYQVLIKVPEGVSLGAELIDLGFDTDLSC